MRGLVSFFLDSRVAANLLALLLIVVGIFAMQSLTIRLFPEINPYTVSITVSYPGASPSEVEEGIVEPIEEQLEGLEGVRKITSLAAENVANVLVELYEGQDTQEKVNEVRTEISQITVFPEQAEEPQVTDFEVEELIAQIVLAGDADPVTLKRLAQDLRTRLANTPEISQARLAGVPDYLIDIAVSEGQLQALGLTLPGIARTVGESSLELSAGEIEGERRRTLVRTVGEAETGEAFADIVVTTSAEGTPVRLGQIADISDALDDTPILARLDGRPAVSISVFRSGDETVFGIIDSVRAEIAAMEEDLPASVDVTLWRDESESLGDRIDLLTRNAIIGLSLVLVLLLLFLDVRIAFWVAIGVGISFLGAFIPMSLLGLSINQLSLFGFILAIGIVVDDAIVVGENIYATREEGAENSKEAARKGTLRVLKPVLFSVSTTIVVFVPLIFLPGQFGQFLSAIAAVVIFVLTLSLIESFTILPKHLSHLRDAPPRRFSPRRVLDPLRDRVASTLDSFSQKRLRPVIALAVTRPLAVILGMVGVLIASVGLLAGGVVKSVFFPEVEGNFVTAELQLAEAASERQTIKSARRIADAAQAAAEAVAETADVDPDMVIDGVFWSLGENVGTGNEQVVVSGGAAANAAFVTVKIQDAAERDFTAVAFENAWREAVGAIPGAQTLAFSSNLVGSGAPIQIEVLSTDETAAREATAALRREIESISGVFDVRDDRFRTTDEVQVALLPAARAYGLTLQEVAAQIRANFFGAEAVRIQRDREEIEVRVRLPEAERQSLSVLKNQRIAVTTEEGRRVYVPIGQVAELSIGDAPAAITRQDGQRTFVISADNDLNRITAGAATTRVLEEIWPSMASDYPEVTVEAGGDQEEQARAIPVLVSGFALSLFAIYALLALAFRSYSQPFVVMSIIPFGLIGALIGHAIFGYALSLLSLFGVIGLAGVIINDALLMVDYINEGLENGKPREKAITDAAVSRFRPILLTTLTTFLGVTPLILEQSVQAAFLVPTAISLGFGILFGTIILMVLVPAVASLHLAGRERAKRWASKLSPSGDGAQKEQEA
ncbi:efflux RND transporter permease subunit [Parvularcula oceani]|uniref:efflux RND transporter permease subunit n=1 Tax=Parvularcula oceani TaxID=1247963 RepID=UPI0006908874|nr:efflux RND transporter permease subunit [Parvularcula oceani]